MHNFTKIKHYDNYLWNVRRERIFGFARVERITCSKCKCLHSKDEFSKAQLSKTIEKRICKGAEGVVWICSHASFSFDEVCALRDKKFPIGRGIEMYDFYVCTHPSHGSTGEELARSAPMICVTSRDGRRRHGSTLVLRSRTLIQIPNSEQIAQKQLESWLDGPENIICPHTLAQHCTAVPEDSLTDPTHSPIYISPLDTTRSACNSGACRVCCTLAQFCADLHCDTCWTIYRRHNDCGGKLDEVVLNVKRQVGPGVNLETTPRNPLWMSQMQTIETRSRKPWRESTCVGGEVFLQRYSGDVERMWLYARSQGRSNFFAPIHVPMLIESKDLAKRLPIRVYINVGWMYLRTISARSKGHSSHIGADKGFLVWSHVPRQDKLHGALPQWFLNAVRMLSGDPAAGLEFIPDLVLIIQASDHKLARATSYRLTEQGNCSSDANLPRGCNVDIGLLPIIVNKHVL